MTVTDSRIADLLCDDPSCALRERAVGRGWVIFECRDLCHTCAQKRGL